jgi:hypothetical protein
MVILSFLTILTPVAHAQLLAMGTLLSCMTHPFNLIRKPPVIAKSGPIPSQKLVRGMTFGGRGTALLIIYLSEKS